MRNAVLTALLLAAALPSQDDQKAVQDFQKRRTKLLIEAGQRHLNLGVWARNCGLVQQASTEFVLAVEVSENQHPGAVTVLSLMRTYQDAFWRKGLQKPVKGLIDRYDTDARRARREDMRARLQLAESVLKRLPLTAKEEYLRLIRQSDGPLLFDDKGRIVLEGGLGLVPEAVASELRKDAIQINGQTFLRDAFLRRLPELKEVFEGRSERFQVRCQTAMEDAAKVLAIAEALFPRLEADLDGRPARPMSLFLFKDRALYETALTASGLGSHKVASGVADMMSFTAAVCAEGLNNDQVLGTVLHELTHLFLFGVTPVVMPSWYSEGLAETYGGDGTFTWKDNTLELGGLMARFRIERIQKNPERNDLDALLATDAVTVVARDRDEGADFYARAWALVRYLRTGAGKDVARKFEEWEMKCRGAALGAVAGRPGRGEVKPADELFRSMFQKELPALRAGFPKFVAGL